MYIPYLKAQYQILASGLQHFKTLQWCPDLRLISKKIILP